MYPPEAASEAKVARAAWRVVVAGGVVAVVAATAMGAAAMVRAVRAGAATAASMVTAMMGLVGTAAAATVLMAALMARAAAETAGICAREPLDAMPMSATRRVCALSSMCSRHGHGRGVGVETTDVSGGVVASRRGWRRE